LMSVATHRCPFQLWKGHASSRTGERSYVLYVNQAAQQEAKEDNACHEANYANDRSFNLRCAGRYFGRIDLPFVHHHVRWRGCLNR
jgi:hypothetical protein